MANLPKSGNALVDDVTARIRSKIMSGEIPIGSQLRQAELASEFEVSRTPIREALRQLQSGGLIEVVPNRGAVVRVPVPWEVREAYEVRAELEALATARSVPRISRETLAEMREANSRMYEHSQSLAAAAESGVPLIAEGEGNDVFHELIHRTSGNSRLTRAINEINEAFPRNVSSLVLIDNPRHREDNFAEHERILAALESGDAETAQTEMRAHVLSAGEHLARWYERRSTTVLLD
ncbi:MAG: GntR family transcriptional regulator [Frondihabitans sp.]|nr:GntR family transcriptional regulator [Frondihabitans sp.]